MIDCIAHMVNIYMNENIWTNKMVFDCNQPTSVDVNAKLHLLFLANIEEILEDGNLNGYFYCFLIVESKEKVCK